MITSTHNPKVQWVRSLQSHSRDRRESQAFVVEGVRLVEEALSAGWPAQLVLYTGGLPERGLQLVEQFRSQGSPVEEVQPQVMKAASDTETPQGILAVLTLHPPPLPPHPGFVLVPDAVRDPGNLGTILRTAAAAGVEAVLLPPGTVDGYAPKVVRAGMGAHFRLPIQAMGWDEIAAYLHHPGLNLQVFLADASIGQPYDQADLVSPLALIMGGEAEGAGQEAQKLADARLHIPMPGKVESLNAAVAAAVLMFEVVRQRNN